MRLDGKKQAGVSYPIFDIDMKIHHKLEVKLDRGYSLLIDIIYKGIVIKDNENRPMYEVQKQYEIIDYFDFKRMLDIKIYLKYIKRDLNLS